MKRFLILLLPVALAGCAVPIGQLQMPMALGPSDSKAACLTYDGAPAYGDCQGKDAVSITRE